jgi:hypothetical protein
MKKIVITLLFIATTISVFSQGEEKRERIKALKIAFITERLELTEIEAQKFWPIYNAHEKEVEMLRHNARDKRRNLKMETLTENEAKKTLIDFIAFEKEQQELKTQFVENLLTAIPAKKIIKLRLAESEFKKRMIQEMKSRRQKFKN